MRHTISCEICQFERQNKLLLDEHMKEKHESNSKVGFKCDKCQSVYSCIPYLNEHFREKH